jgi:RES domain
MDSLFAHLTVLDVHTDVVRNIVSIRTSQDLFDDLTDKPDEWALAQQVEDSVKPPPYRSATPIIHRPFEDAQWFHAIGWPFKHWQASRYSDGSFGIWYGCDSAQTSVYETAYHWFNGLLADAGFDKQQVSIERKLYQVTCDAALLDFRPMCSKYAGLMHKTDYRFTQSIGTRLHREGHPGLVTRSVRHAEGQNYAVLNPDVLTNPRAHSALSYRLDGHRILIQKQPGVAWLEIATAAL